MESLTECKGTGCGLAIYCHRYNPEPEEDYLAHPPYDHKTQTCEMLWSDNSEKMYQGLKRLVKGTN